MIITPAEERFWRHVEKGPGCWIWIGAKVSKGYGKFGEDRKKSPVFAHRFSYRVAHGLDEIPVGMLICHSCDNPSCVNPRHLFMSDQKGNMDDMRAKGRAGWHQGAGKWKGKNKLSPEQVQEIRRKYIPRKVTRKVLAEEYGVHESTIKNIITGRTWEFLRVSDPASSIKAQEV